MTVSGYPVIGQVETESGQMVPLVDIPMMSDERWQQLAEEEAVKHYIRENGKPPESIEAPPGDGVIAMIIMTGQSGKRTGLASMKVTGRPGRSGRNRP